MMLEVKKVLIYNDAYTTHLTKQEKDLFFLSLEATGTVKYKVR